LKIHFRWKKKVNKKFTKKYFDCKSILDAKKKVNKKYFDCKSILDAKKKVNKKLIKNISIANPF
jgi:hypothetical protein